MTARKLVTSDGTVQVSGEGYATTGAFSTNGGVRTAADDAVLYHVLRAAAACNDAELGQQNGHPTVVGTRPKARCWSSPPKEV
jgi:Ca2+-transporting ATPase